MDGARYITEVREEFAKLRALAEGALEQVDDSGFFARPDDVGNSLAVLVKHLAGNQRSRWTDFLTTDGEKADRNRESEFVLDQADTRSSLMRHWKSGWEILDAAVASLGPEDLDRDVTIRGEPHTVTRAIHRQLTHYGYHVGQIVLIARRVADGRWRYLSVPPGGTQEFNASMRKRFPS